MKQYRILLSNIGYCTKLNGSYLDYVVRFYRYFYRPKTIESQVLKTLQTIIHNENPDVCCLIEVESAHVKTLANKNYPCAEFNNKYGQKSFLRKIPLFLKKGNGFLARSQYVFKKHFFKNGTKKLIYEIKLDSQTSIFMAHFSLNKQTRAKQFEEINQLVKNVPNTIICGDFNIFSGFQELNPLLENGNFRIINTEKNTTFPAYKPSKILDIFITSKNIKIKNLRVLKDQFSDHLPVILDFTI